MNDRDRVSIHEAMEQQTVTISKAGIHASLNARCSVLAAANPVYGQYDRKRRLQENIGLPDSLLSRFDLLFVVLDQLDPESDRLIATHVIEGHQYRRSHMQTENDDEVDDETSNISSNTKSQSVWLSSRHGSTMNSYSQSIEDEKDSQNILNFNFLRKYFHFAKARVKPKLTDEARECIANRYAEMRSRQDERTLPITARSLETIIRLATAHAKARLSNIVEGDPDCTAAMDVLAFALYHENNQNVTPATPVVIQPNDVGDTRRTHVDNNDDIDRSVQGGKETKRQRTNENEPDHLIMRIWDEIKNIGEGQCCPIEDLCQDLVDRNSIVEALTSMEKDNRIMISDDHIYRV